MIPASPQQSRAGDLLRIGDPARGLETRQLSILFGLYVLAMCVFALLHPVLEWPDAEIHLTDSCQREVAFPSRSLLDAVGQDVCAFSYRTPLEEFKFFSDQTSNLDLHWVNPIWTYILPQLLCLAALFLLIALSGNRDAVGNPMIFAPPLAFYLSNVNVEAFGLFLVILAYFVFNSRRWLAMLLTCAATVIDRSHVCSLLTLFLLSFFRSSVGARLLPLFLVVVVALYIARLAGFFGILDVLSLLLDSVTVFGISGKDILSNASFGSRGYAALLASAAGLYGAMSYRPVLWILYYGLFFMLLAIGYRQSGREERRVLMICVAAALSIMFILPPLSQARYFPLLIISMWSMVLKGGRWFGVPPVILQVFFFCWTMVSVIAANVSHIVSN